MGVNELIIKEMKANKILAAALLFVGGLSASAQETVTEYSFVPHWYVQGQFGAQETVGENTFSKLLSPNAQLGVGYKFNPVLGARLSVNAWQSKASNQINGPMYQHDYDWKWNYVAPSANLMVDLTNLLGGYNPNRLVDVNFIAGLGVNFGFNNKEAEDANAHYANMTKIAKPMLGNLWSGSKALLLGQVGADVNFNLTKNFAVGCEVNVNCLSDQYNSKKAGNADWYVNGLVGFRYSFGATSKKTTRTIPAPEPVIVEKIVEKIVEIPVEKIVYVEKQPAAEAVNEANLRRDIFFKIATCQVSKDEMAKVQEVAKFLKENPAKKVVITGYADRGTGTPAINNRLCKQRAQAVANVLINTYKIAKNRITVKAMGANEKEPFATPAENRVAIAVCN